MASSKYDIASAALVLVGAGPVTSFASTTAAPEIALNQIYDQTVENLYSLYPWRFATKVVQLSKLVAVPDNKWGAAYSVPSDCIRVQNVLVVGEPVEYDRIGSEIHTTDWGTQEIYMTYVYDPGVSEWPGYFTKLVTYDLAQQLALSLAAKLDLSKAYGQKYETQFRFAKSADSQQQTAKKLDTQGAGSIIAHRRS